MRAFRRLFRLVWGGEVEPALRPLLAVSLVSSIAGSSGFTFVGIWAIRELGADKSDLGIAFLVGAFASAGAGYLGGHLSDHIGRRPLILFSLGSSVVYWLGFLLVGSSVTANWNGNQVTGTIASTYNVFDTLPPQPGVGSLVTTHDFVATRR